MMAYHFQDKLLYVYMIWYCIIYTFIEFTIIAGEPSTPEIVATGKQSTAFLVCLFYLTMQILKFVPICFYSE